VKRVALALSALLFAACDPQISSSTIDAGDWDAGGLECAENPCLNDGACRVVEEGFQCVCVPGFEGDLCEVDVNDCEPNPCKNDGLCSDRVASYSCACAPGFTGVDCSTNTDECADSPCENGGACTDMVNGYQCDCAAGYSGSRCEVDVDDCATSPCENGGECQDEVNGFTCICTEGNVGLTCSNQIEVCSEGICQHGGTCENSDEGYKCTCAAGYNGVNCENDIDDCSPSPCQNDANCVDEVNGYTCQCPDGFEGVNCEILINPCDPDPCQNGGVCTVAGDFFECECQEGFNGTTCQNNIDDCATNPCANGGTCTDGANGFTCECPNGFTGATCNNESDACPGTNPCVNGQCVPGTNGSGYTCDCNIGFIGATCEVNVNDCDPDPCDNGTCTDGANSYQCECEPDYQGPECQSVVDACDADPCLNGGACVDTVGGFECTCVAGWTGDTCAEEVDECDPNPCQNNGTCTDGINTYICDCPGGFSGVNCEEDHCDIQGACGNGMCDGQGGCVCAVGWEGDDCRDNIDECTIAMPCQNGGECTDTDGSFNCACAEGYTGAVCDECADGYQDNDDNGICCRTGWTGADCLACDLGYESVSGVCQRTCNSAPKNCGEHGTCDDAGGDTTCICDDTYYGDLCDSFMGTCLNANCGSNGSCEVTSTNTYKCECEPGYVGRNCETLDECALAVANQETPCQNGGTCVDGDNAFTCTCLSGWTGADCSEVQACQVAVANGETPCNGNGTCVDGTGASDASYTCMCNTGWLGLGCGVVDRCVGHACQNGSTCVNGVSDYTCDCTGLDYEGNRCQTQIDDCAANPCMNGGLCVDGNRTFTCNCAGLDYEGDRCQTQINNCDPNPCLNGGACTDGDRTFTCNCGGLDFTGDRCQTQIDDCASNPCLNGGTCVDGNNTYTCNCADDYIGTNCETLEDDCAPNPCSNGGVCSNAGTTFACDCTGTGWSGTTCQTDFDECTQANICGDGVCGNFLSGGGYNCTCPDGTVDVDADGTNCAETTRVYAGATNSCAISSAGSLHCWGDNTYGQLGQGNSDNPASGVRTPFRVGTGTNWSKVSIGGHHLCGLRDGHLFCWGRNDNLQISKPPSTAKNTPVEIRPDLTWTDVSAGNSHTCALAGTALYCWGNSADGQAGAPTESTNVDAPKQIAGTWSKVSAGGFHTCAINAANQLHCWGRSSSHQTGGAPPIALPGDADGPWSSVEAGPLHTCAVAGTRTYCWGEGSKGALGDGEFNDNATPQLVSTGTTLGSLATGTDFSCGATAASPFQLYCWGTNDTGLLFTGGDVNQPALIATGDTPVWDSYAVGDTHMCGVDNGFVRCWGSNADGAVGHAAPSATPVTTPSLIKSAAMQHSATDNCAPNPCRNGGVCSEAGNSFTCNCAGTGYSGPTCTVGTDECATAGICGEGSCRDLLDDDGYSCTCPDGLIDVDDGTNCEKAGVIAAGVNHTCVLTETARTLHCWGSNRYGQFGLGMTGTTAYYTDESTQAYRTPLRLRTIGGVTTDARGWTHLVVGENVTCGTLPNDQGAESLYCWGDNSLGQTGMGTIASTAFNNAMPPALVATVVPDFYATPQLLDATRTWIALATSYATTCGIDSTNTLYCWGLNKYGQVGNGQYGNPGYSDVNAPTGNNGAIPVMYANRVAVAPPSGQTWVSVFPGNAHTCARTNMNELYCWGRRNVGQAGVGTTIAGTTDLLLPAKVDKPDPQGFTGIWSDITHSCALVGNAAWCWGQGTTGGIGNGGTTNRNLPTLVSGSLSFERLTLGSNFGCGLVAVPSTTPQAYSAYCWGNNTKNMLLTGAATATVPTAVNTSRQWELLDLGSTHACGLDQSDGKLYCWGDNGLEGGVGTGKLGSVPYQVTGNVGLVGPVRNARSVHAAQ